MELINASQSRLHGKRARRGFVAFRKWVAVLQGLKQLDRLVVQTPAQLARPLRGFQAESQIIRRWTRNGKVTHPQLNFIGLYYANGNTGLGHVESEWTRNDAGDWGRTRSEVIFPVFP